MHTYIYFILALWKHSSIISGIYPYYREVTSLTFIPSLRATPFPSACFTDYFCFGILQFLQDVPGLEFTFIYSLPNP